MIRRVNI